MLVERSAASPEPEDGDAFKTGDAVIANVNNLSSGLSIYPNPVKDRLTIDGDYSTVDIFDIFGKLVISTEKTKSIDVSTLANGVYTLYVVTEKGIYTEKVTITK